MESSSPSSLRQPSISPASPHPVKLSWAMLKIRVIEEDYMNIFENIIKNKIAYPKKNPCFNLSFSKFYGNQYLFCIRNVILYKQLVENLDLYPGIFKYSKDDEGNIHDNNDLSNVHDKFIIN
jgi:hypothetical protein